MKGKRNLHLSAMFFSVFLQAISILQYFLKNEEDHIINWIPQYGGILVASILLTVFQYTTKHAQVRAPISLIRLVLLFIGYLPSGVYIGLKQMFLFAFLIDMSFLFAFPVNAIVSVLSYVSIAVGTALSLHWTKNTQAFVLADFLYVTLFSSVLIFVFTLFRIFLDSHTTDRVHIDYLKKTINKLTDANTGFQHYIQIAEEKSSEDERNRIIREIHDSIGYTLTTIIMLSTSILESSDETAPSTIKEVMSNINAYAKNGLTDIRIALRILKIKKDVDESDLDKLERMITAFKRATNLEIVIDYGNLNRNYRSDISHLVFRLIQESMVNSLRHGLATRIGIHLFEDNESVIVTVSDNGRGFSDLSLGIGLNGIRERIDRVNGDFTITSNNGVTLRASIPLTRIEQRGAD